MCCPNITRAAGHPSVARHKDRASGTWSSTPQSSLAQATTSEGVSLNVLEPILTTGARFSWTSSGKGGLSLEVKTRHQQTAISLTECGHAGFPSVNLPVHGDHPG